MTGSLTTQADLRLTVARGHGDHLVHLVAPFGARALCHQPIRVRPLLKTFGEAGCGDCLRAALEAGHVAALESDHTWMDLRRMQPRGG